jgi:hypothetical protein
MEEGCLEQAAIESGESVATIQRCWAVALVAGAFSRLQSRASSPRVGG